MIRANCRDKFNADDFDFIADSLAKNSKSKVALTELLSDTETRDAVLDHPVLFESVTKSPGLSKISSYLYFYVLTRHVFLQNRIENRQMTDYVACVLADFSSVKRAHRISKAHKKPYHYLTDMMYDLSEASSYEAFLIRSHLGNYALFMTGMFPDAIYKKTTYGRKAPGFDYYEKMGKSSFRWASQHRIAVKYSLGEILANLADQFRHVRLALNNLADNYVLVRNAPDSLDVMLRQIFFGNSNNPTSQA